jgi:hypothetical protein
MTTATRDGKRSWEDADQADLAQALALLKQRLRRHAGRAEDPALDELWPGQVVPERRPRAVEALCRAFGLSPFERDLLVLCAGIELDSTVSPLCAAAQGDPSRNYPTFSLALAALSGAHWSALSPAAPLRRWRLIEVVAGPILTLCPLRIDERVLHHLLGVPHMDERLAGMIEPLRSIDSDDLAPSHRIIADQLTAAWTTLRDDRSIPLIQLHGPDPSERRVVAAAAAAAVGLRLATISADFIPTAASELDALARLWEREAALGGVVLLVECDDADPSHDQPRQRRMNRLVERLAGMVIVSDRERRTISHRQALGLHVPRPTSAEQQIAWRSALGVIAKEDPTGVDAIAAQFNLGLPAIRSAAAQTVARCTAGPGESPTRNAWENARSLCRSHLDDLAQRIEPLAGWDDLVLPGPHIEALRRIARHVRNRAMVHHAWGFAAKSARGLGIGSLFAGVSGTGKTMAAEVLAGALHLDLYRIDLAGVVSKYIGETEKNLRRVFDAAEQSGAILLFDEADALFGKRSEVKDSHDRYANIEVSYLLQRMEAYRGLAILTTNLKNALDPAFLRRIRFVIQFPFPDAASRGEIWRRIFPASTPTEGLDHGKLARLNVPGGNIRNIAMNAAFLAADRGEPVRMTHLAEAARIEYGNLERPLTEAEIRDWM